MASPVTSTASVHPKRILVIGGGPTGLVALRNLTERGEFERVELVERRDDVGGVWYLDSQDSTGDRESSRPRWPSPAYPGLIGNVLPEFISFSYHPFPERPFPHQPFATLTETHEYLRAFAGPFLKKGAIRLNTEVTVVEEQGGGAGWKVSMKDWSDTGKGTGIEEVWDGVVIANGWYDNPVWPETEGLREIKELGLAKHAKWWRGPVGYEGKKVLVVGNANSSNDIAAQLAGVARSPVYQSIRRVAFPGFPSLPDERIVMVAPVARYTSKLTPEGPKIDIKLSDGSEIPDVDEVQIGTGYKHLPDFVHVLGSGGRHAPIVPPSTTPHRVPSLHRHILYAHNPTLAFIGAPMSYTPFTVADVSSTWLTLAWSGEIEYPGTVEGRLAYEKARLEAVEKFRGSIENPSSLMVYNVLGNDEEEYAKGLKEDIVRVREGLKDVLPEWSKERTRHREAMFPVKFAALQYARDHGNQEALQK